MMLVMSIHEEIEKKEEHVLKFMGSIKGMIVVNWDRIKGARDVNDDYFKPNLVFREVFSVRSHLLLHIVDGVKEHDPYFMLRKDCCEQLSFPRMQKYTTDLRMLSCGTSGGVVDEITQMGENTCIDQMVRFVAVIMKVFEPEYF